MNKSFHFIAIGGVGQSALAKLLLIKGFKVSGSDIKQSKYTKMLQELGADIQIGHSPDNIKPCQTVVISSAIKQDNPELIQARKLNLPIYHRSDILQLISKQYPCFIGFSGTHGKTTTSGLCSYILQNMNEHPAFASGGIITGLNTNADAHIDSKIFIAELDESDGTIIKYSPDYIVINNLQPDHFDFYKNGIQDLLSLFKDFVNKLKPGAKIFINIDDSGVQELYGAFNNRNFIKYSTKDFNANYFAGNIKLNSFDLYKNQAFISNIEMGIKGLHNIYNCLGVISVLLELNFDINRIKPYVQQFSGMKRRFETVYNKDFKIVDDYAHHPEEIIATLNSAKKQTQGKIIAIFQPHRYTRLKALWNDFLNSFELADELFVVDTYSAGDEPDEYFNSRNFSKTINHKCVKYVDGNMDDAARKISNYINKNDLVLTIGAGDVTKIAQILGGYYERNRT